MKGFLIVVAVVVGVVMRLGAAEPAGSVADLRGLEGKVEAVAVRSLPATVALVSERNGSSGSGVIVSKEGLILTAAHVTQGLKEVDVYFPNGKKYVGRVLGANYSKDVGMVMMEGGGV